MKLTGRTILITGGTSGIGFELAKQLIAQRNTVLITGRDAQRLATTKSKLSVHTYLLLQLYLAQWQEDREVPGPKGRVVLHSFRGLKPPAPSVIFDLQL